MKIPITPGTLCWLRGGLQANIGKVVEALYPVQDYQGADTSMHGVKCWVVQCKSPVTLRDGMTLEFVNRPAGTPFLTAEDTLVPIAGPGLEDEVSKHDSKHATLGDLLCLALLHAKA